ncbi:MAG: hypothetical protein M3Z54_12305 [Gemmatimonadota bacterium]|nr:hypothetical protein [Gemmatimonadota bacterium]
MIDKTKNEYRLLSSEIDAVLADKTNAAITSRMTLRDAVCGFVVAEQARGTTRKSVIQTVKKILKEAEERAGAAAEKTEYVENGLSKQLVDWCIAFHRQELVAIAARPQVS